MSLAARTGLLFFLAMGLLAAGPAVAEQEAPRSAPDSRLLDRAVPDIPLRLSDGRQMRLSELWGERPLLVTFFYGRCNGVCTPFLQWLRDAARDVGGMGQEYRILALSFDGTDTGRELDAQADALGLLNSRDWIFATTDKDALGRITGALEFWYRFDPVTRQFDHNALAVGVERGRVVRALTAKGGDPKPLRELLWEMRGKFVPFYAVPGQTPLTCFSFDAATGTTRLDWGMLLLLLPALLACLAAGTVFAPRAPGARACAAKG